ncbi:low affinity iron permease family protein [Nonomuraea ceibae]|uniref:low affinity iron permease family protein n=1 Tax=Nonomuraea ceibae TaxID=1935170 RepID=UPI001C5FC363|nr:low affinity iron permease family protein [Nonomuraea ceibae]
MTSDQSSNDRQAIMPSDVTARLSFFDRFASRAAAFVSGAWFFAMCVLLVLIWAPSYFMFGSLDIWQLVINTATTIVTFLLVALLQNSQRRSDDAIQHQLNAIADGLADFMAHVAREQDAARLRDDLGELRAAAGLEDKEGS